nr:MAG TPA: hypothetical protein [Caudoviricetes sp.]
MLSSSICFDFAKVEIIIGMIIIFGEKNNGKLCN